MASPGGTNFTIISIAVILSGQSPPSVGSVSGEQVRELIGHPTSVIQGAIGQAFVTSAQGQFELFLMQGNKIDFRDLSGDMRRASDRMPKIVNGFLEQLGNPALESYGVNFVLELEEGSPAAWLSSTFLSPDLKGKMGGRPLSSNHIGITLDQFDSVVTLGFTDGGGRRVGVSYNASRQLKAIPDPQSLGQELRDRHSDLSGILDALRSKN